MVDIKEEEKIDNKKKKIIVIKVIALNTAQKTV